MEREAIEKCIRSLNDCIADPKDRMSEAAIGLMIRLVETTIATTEGAITQVLIDRGLILRAEELQ